MRSVVCLVMRDACSTNQRPENGRNSLEHDQKLIRQARPIMKCSTKLSAIRLMVCLRRNFLMNHRPGNGGNSVERDYKLIRPGEAHDEFGRQILAKSNQKFVC